MTVAWIERPRCAAFVLLMGLWFYMSLPGAAAAPEGPPSVPQCNQATTTSPNVHETLTSLVDWLMPYADSGPKHAVDCLTSEDAGDRPEDRGPARLGVAPNPTVGDVPLNKDYTLSGLVEHNAAPSIERTDSDVQMRLGENISLLAEHIDVTKELMRTFVQVSGVASPNAALDERVPQELSLQLGGTTLEAKADFMAGLTQYLARSLMNADVPLPESGDDVTLVFNMSGGVSGLDISTVLQQTKQKHDLSNPLNIGEITVKISNGNVTSQAELDPANDAVKIKRGKFAVDYHFGSNTLTSTTTFSRGEGVQEQRFQLTAELGSVDFTGEASILNNTGQQAFKLAAFWEGLTFSTLVTPQGFRESSFGLDLEF